MAEIIPNGRDLSPDPSAPPPPQPGEVTLWVCGGKGKAARFRPRPPSPWWMRVLLLLLTSAGIFGGIVLLVFSFRWGLALILDPKALPQLQALLLAPITPQSLTPTTTLAELQRQAETADQVLGAPIHLTDEKGEDWLIFPVLEAKSKTIVQLRLVQQSSGPQADQRLLDVASLTIAPFSPEQVLAPLPAAERQATVAPKTFNAQRLALLPTPPNPTPYHWLTLEGQWSRQGASLRYGQIVVFDPERRRLDLAAVWSSPAEQVPTWADLDGEGLADLVINETNGIDPMLQGLRVVATAGFGPAVQLQPVSWAGFSLEDPAATSQYHTALRLARSGLWHEAQGLLQTLKEAYPNQWTPVAEAQLRLVDRHGTITRNQASQDWSMPTQKIVALLIDGQWDTALDQLETAPELLPALMRRMGADQGRLWKRISAAASLPDPSGAVFVWGGLALEAQQHRQAAQNWLERQPVTSADRNRLEAVLATLDRPPQPNVARLASAPADPAESEEAALAPLLQGVIGQATPVQSMPPGDWYFPNGQPPQLVEGEQWYVVDAPVVRRGQQWRSAWPRLGTQATPERIWPALPFANQPSLTLVRWQTSALGVSQNLYVKGLRVNNRIVQFLAAGTALPAPSALPPLTFSEGALVWLSNSRGSAPDSTRTLRPLMNEIMRHHGPLPENLGTAPLGTLLQDMQHHTIDLTGDGQPERVLTLDQSALDQLQGLGVKLDRTAHKTVILTQDDELLYSDLFQPQTFIALTNPADGYPLSLVVHRGQGYGLLHWSATARQFQP